MFAMADSVTQGTPRLSSGLDMAGLGARLRLERFRHDLSLQDLEARTGVSRSMLSAVERGGKAPTVLVLDRIATGLDTSIARLIGEERGGGGILLRHTEEEVARDPGGLESRTPSPVPARRGVQLLGPSH